MQGEERVRILTGTEGDSFLLMEIRPGETEAPERWDYVLVADRCTQRNAGQVRRQQHFLEELERKGFHYKTAGSLTCTTLSSWSLRVLAPECSPPGPPPSQPPPGERLGKNWGQEDRCPPVFLVQSGLQARC
ncbi:anoctamin-9-like [Lontra canadensis]|uniref:anoctamin-9-like n=1 Tax=Lontra canadensis TaxID=76717 RepID=UPI0013F36183|nr:anoctamin-9-like [Lontra canadensis]